jgi:hypothetical protein
MACGTRLDVGRLVLPLAERRGKNGLFGKATDVAICGMRRDARDKPLGSLEIERGSGSDGIGANTVLRCDFRNSPFTKRAFLGH